ncbi:hypothetical protein [Nocardia sp. CA-135398]|uniref:hypothetical protein n=1 Tax=Nocardia sp. CA-135398 TaxID=3239977 RepID=UPI003D9603FE
MTKPISATDSTHAYHPGSHHAAGPPNCGKPVRESITIGSTPITVRDARDAYLDAVRSPNTRRACVIAVYTTAHRLGQAIETLWGEAAVNTWNARRAALACLVRRVQRRSL